MIEGLQSLTLTKEVFEERKQLEVKVEGLQSLIQRRLEAVEVIGKKKKLIQTYRLKLQAHEEFKVQTCPQQSSSPSS